MALCRVSSMNETIFGNHVLVNIVSSSFFNKHGVSKAYYYSSFNKKRSAESQAMKLAALISV